MPPGLSAPFVESEELLVVELEVDVGVVVLLLPSRRCVVVPLGEPSGASEREGPSTLALPGAACVVVELPGSFETLVVVVDWVFA